jgi:hypothetical protein
MVYLIHQKRSIRSAQIRPHVMANTLAQKY